MTDKEFNRSQGIANTILMQMGGYSKLNAMIGIKDLFAVENGVRFKIKCRGSKVNYVKIELTPMDLYKIEFGKLWGSKYKVIEEVDGIYGDMLKGMLEKASGLYLSL